MNRFGQAITWAAIAAPHIFSGECMGYSLRDAATQQNIEDEAAEFMAMVLHSRKGDLSFEAKVSAASTDFLNLSAGAAITVSTIETGTVLATRAVETWRLEQPKMASIQGTWFPDFEVGDGAVAGTDLNVFTPDQTALGILFPSSEVIYGTYGLGHAAGVVHGLTIEQQLTITEDEPSPDGKILGAATHGYIRSISLEILAKAAKPAVGSLLSVTGAPAHGAGYRIVTSEERFAEKRGMMYAVTAAWIPAMG